MFKVPFSISPSKISSEILINLLISLDFIFFKNKSMLKDFFRSQLAEKLIFSS